MCNITQGKHVCNSFTQKHPQMFENNNINAASFSLISILHNYITNKQHVAGRLAQRNRAVGLSTDDSIKKMRTLILNENKTYVHTKFS